MATILILDYEFKLNLGQYRTLEKIDEGKTLKFSDDRNDVTLIKLDKDKGRAFLICSDNRQYELSVERLANKLMICIPTGTPNENLLVSFAEHIQRNLMSFVISLVIRLTDLDTFRDVEISDNDWKVLLNDRRFTPLLEKSNKLYQEKITQIMNVK
jgi:hypothetical protein